MSHNRLYISLINTQRWRALRAKTLGARPLCEVCLKEGRVTPATEVHHVRGQLVLPASMMDAMPVRKPCCTNLNMRSDWITPSGYIPIM